MFSAAIKSGAAGSPKDPQFNYVTMLLHGDGSASGNTTVTPFNADASTNNFNVAINGDARSNNFTPYQGNGYYGNNFPSTGSYLSVPYSSDFNLTGDFTVEFWMNPSNLPTSTGSAPQSYCRIFSFGTYNAANSFGLEIGSLNSKFYYITIKSEKVLIVLNKKLTNIYYIPSQTKELIIQFTRNRLL